MLLLAFSLARSSFVLALHRLVEFFSPYCPHCQQFAPIWQDVLEMQEHLATDSDFHMSRVNCIEQGGAWALALPSPFCFARHRHD